MSQVERAWRVRLPGRGRPARFAAWPARFAARLAVLAVAVAVWQFAVRLVPVGKRLDFPPPSAIVADMRQLWFTGPAAHLFLNSAATGTVLPSLARTLTGWAIAAVIGVPVGLLLGRWRVGLDIADPVIQFFRAVPPPVLVPVFIVLFKIGNTMHVAVIVFGVIWPILLNAIDGARSVDPLQLDTARVLRLSGLQRFGWVILPGTAQQIFAGLRISLSLSIILMVISEMVGTTNGIGSALITAQQSYAITDIWAIIVLLGILGYLLNSLLLAAEHRILSWTPRETAP